MMADAALRTRMHTRLLLSVAIATAGVAAQDDGVTHFLVRSGPGVATLNARSVRHAAEEIQSVWVDGAPTALCAIPSSESLEIVATTDGYTLVSSSSRRDRVSTRGHLRFFRPSSSCVLEFHYDRTMTTHRIANPPDPHYPHITDVAIASGGRTAIVLAEVQEASAARPEPQLWRIDFEEHAGGVAEVQRQELQLIGYPYRIHLVDSGRFVAIESWATVSDSTGKRHLSLMMFLVDSKGQMRSHAVLPSRYLAEMSQPGAVLGPSKVSILLRPIDESVAVLSVVDGSEIARLPLPSKSP